MNDILETLDTEAVETDKCKDFTAKNGLLNAKNKSSIFLSGFMGAGKSTVGRILAEKLNMPFYDTDELIEKELAMSVGEMFEKMGESYFRVVEHSFLDKLAKMKGVVVACGGGVFLTQKNYFTAAMNGVVVYLEADEKFILENLRNEENRPLLKGGNREMRVHQLMLLRKPLYEKNCDLKIKVCKTPEETALKIIEKL